MKAFKEGWGWALILATFFSACGQHYSNDISSRLKAQNCKSLPLNDSLLELDSLGYVAIIPTDGNPTVCDSIYTVEKTWWQAWQAGKKDGSVLIFYLGLLGVAVFLGLLYRAFQNNDRDSNSRAPLGWLVPVFACAIISAMALNWDKWNSGREIRKQDYIEYIHRDGDLRNFWTTPVKDH